MKKIMKGIINQVDSLWINNKNKIEIRIIIISSDELDLSKLIGKKVEVIIK